ncbi:MAG: DNA repair protein RecN [Hydrogenothermaceae bacterium]
MLTNVTIKKFLYFQDISIDFQGGLNVFTGETGAGKSLILDAIEFVFGKKSFDDEAFVELTFEVENDYSEDGILILSRQIKNGKSIYYLNGRKVTKSMLEEIFPSLLEIHGQHQSQNLFKRDYQRDVFDKFAKVEDVLKQYQSVYTEYKNLLREIQELRQKQSERLRMIDILKYQITELENLNLKRGEKEKIEEEYRYLKNIQLIKEGVSSSLNILSERVIPDLRQIDKTLQKISNFGKNIESVYNDLKEAKIIVENIYYSLSSFDEYDNQDITAIEERLNQINFLERKYNTNADGLIELLENLKVQLESFENLEYELPILEKKVKEVEEKLYRLAESLSQRRKEAVKSFEDMVISHLKELAFLSVDFKVSIEDKQLDLYGKDKIEFLFSSNKGFELKPLSEIASGGEISRVSLAIKLVSKKSVPTMIFDEIDTGIGGKTALSMAKKLKELSKDFQIILITHLPQIAAVGDNHYHIEKKLEEDKTIGIVKRLDEEDRVLEIVRMLKGEIDEKSIEYAREFINTLKE